MSNIVLIPCAGIGHRFGADIPKQYLELTQGKTILDYTLESFLAIPVIDKIIIITSPNDNMIDKIISKYNDKRLIVYKVGGETRALTVKNGIIKLSQYAKDNDWILVHDAARCLITPELITRLMNQLNSDEVGGILALAVHDTVKQVLDDNIIQQTLERSHIYLAQTPQMFRFSVLSRVFLYSNLSGITDEASAVEQLGFKVKIVNGEISNIKITHVNDLDLARFYISQNNKIDKYARLK